MQELKDLEFLASKSKELLDKQIQTYSQKKTYAVTIIGVSALFIPFFLTGLKDSYFCIQLISVVPTLMFIGTIIVMLRILRTKPLDRGFAMKKFDSLVNEKYDKILLFEIGANRDSFKDNKPIADATNKEYNFGVQIIIAAIIFSIVLLLVNSFFKPKKAEQIIKVELINPNKMDDNNQDNPIPTENTDDTSQTPREIPTVSPGDRERLSEGVDAPKPDPKPDKE